MTAKQWMAEILFAPLCLASVAGSAWADVSD
jgi:hypothetical protein